MVQIALKMSVFCLVHSAYASMEQDQCKDWQCIFLSKRAGVQGKYLSQECRCGKGHGMRASCVMDHGMRMDLL